MSHNAAVASVVNSVYCTASAARDFDRMQQRVELHRHSAVRDMQGRRERGAGLTAREISQRKRF